MTASQERCVFPYSSISIFSPTQNFEWHEERYGSRKLPVKKWTIVIETNAAKDERKLGKISFKETVRKILVGRQINQGIVGSIKGKVLIHADLPKELEQNAAKQLDWVLPRRRGFLIQGVGGTTVITTAIRESAEYTATDGIGFDEELFDIEEMEEAFDHFLQKLDDLDEEDLEEITCTLKTGLKSWLSFGATMAQNKPDSKGPDGPAPNRLRTLLRATAAETNTNEITPEMDKGPPLKSAVRANNAMMKLKLSKGDDKLTRKAEEQANKISGDFCSWLRDLPEGEDDSINNTSPEKIRTLFDSTHVAKPNTSKLVEGLRSWAKFGQDMVIGSDQDWVGVAKEQMSKVRVKKKLALLTEKAKRRREAKRRGKKKASSLIKSKKKPVKLQDSLLDHRKYGVWYLEPEEWEKRFRQDHKPEALSKIKMHRRAQLQSQEAKAQEKPESLLISGDQDEEDEKLHSIEAFRSFLAKRENYVPPPFLKKALRIESS